jgi:hypothetical protein
MAVCGAFGGLFAAAARLACQQRVEWHERRKDKKEVKAAKEERAAVRLVSRLSAFSMVGPVGGCTE